MIEIDGKKRTVCAWIPARGGSKGVPGKALRDLNGKPLIAHTIEAALGIGGVDVVCVNTDDEKIRDVAVSFGAEAPFLRPAELAGDTSRLDMALRYQWDWYLEHRNFIPDIHIGMSPTYPFRKKARIDDALEMVRDDKRIFNVRSLIQVPNEVDNVWGGNNNKLERFVFPGDTGTATVPLYRDSFSFNVVVDHRSHIPGAGPTPLTISDVESIDIDEIEDLELARFIAKKGKAADFVSHRHHRDDALCLFGKPISEFVPFGCDNILHHPDYPMVTQADYNEFKRFCSQKKRAVITGCEIQTPVHPYRLMMRFQQIYSRYVVDIPQTIRGRRQAYPQLFRFVPALLYLPKGNLFDLLKAQEELLMYPIPADKGWDRKKTIEKFQVERKRGELSNGLL